MTKQEIKSLIMWLNDNRGKEPYLKLFPDAARWILQAKDETDLEKRAEKVFNDLTEFNYSKARIKD